jgi:hypothetical protein
MAAHSFQMSGLTQPMTQHNVPEDLHHQQYACENLNSQANKSFFILPNFLHSSHNKA